MMLEKTSLFVGAVTMTITGFISANPSFVAGGVVLMWIGIAVLNSKLYIDSFLIYLLEATS